MLKPTLTDEGRLLSRSEVTRLRQVLREFEQRFPQLRISVVIRSPDQTYNRTAYLFWMFNRGGLHSAVEKAGNNRHVLVWLDPEVRGLSAMIGYGLEPLVSEEMLTNAIAAAGPRVDAWRPVQAVGAFCQALGSSLADTAESFDRVFGWDLKGDWVPLDGSENPRAIQLGGRRESVY